jgi:hypothetical protein
MLFLKRNDLLKIHKIIENLETSSDNSFINNLFIKIKLLNQLYSFLYFINLLL